MIYLVLEITDSSFIAVWLFSPFFFYQVPQPGTLKLSHFQEGTYIFQLTVTDTAGQQSSDNVSVTVLPMAHSAVGEKLSAVGGHVMPRVHCSEQGAWWREKSYSHFHHIISPIFIV